MAEGNEKLESQEGLQKQKKPRAGGAFLAISVASTASAEALDP
jgi:hypothetical protein